MNGHRAWFLLLTFVLGASLLAPVEGEAVDDKYRVALPFEEVKVTRQVSEALQQKNYGKLENAINLLEPVLKHLNEQYATGGGKRTLLKDIKGAVSSGDDAAIRDATVRFLFYNLRDLLRLGHEYAKEGNTSRAGVYVKKGLLIYKASLQPFIENQGDKSGAIRAVSTGIQKLNQSLGSPGAYGSEMEKVEEALRKLFPRVSG